MHLVAGLDFGGGAVKACVVEAIDPRQGHALEEGWMGSVTASDDLRSIPPQWTA